MQPGANDGAEKCCAQQTITVSAGMSMVAVIFLVILLHSVLIDTTMRPVLHTSPAYDLTRRCFCFASRTELHMTLRYHANGGRDPNYIPSSCTIMCGLPRVSRTIRGCSLAPLPQSEPASASIW